MARTGFQHRACLLWQSHLRTDFFGHDAGWIGAPAGQHEYGESDDGWVGIFSGFGGDAARPERNKYLSNGIIEDANGNQINLGTGKDTLGRQMPAFPGPANPAATPPGSSASLTTYPALGYAHQSVTYAYTWNLPTVNGGSLPLTLCYASV